MQMYNILFYQADFYCLHILKPVFWIKLRNRKSSSRRNHRRCKRPL